MSDRSLFAMRSVVCAVSIGAGIVGPANAAPVSAHVANIHGTALVATEAANIEATKGMQLQIGDRLMVMNGGTAMVEYSDGCRYSVNAETLLTIAGVSACASEVDGVRETRSSTTASTAVSAVQPTIGDSYPSLTSVIYGGSSASAAAGVTSTGAAAPAVAGSLAWVPAAIAGGVAVGAGIQINDSRGNGSSISP